MYQNTQCPKSIIDEPAPSYPHIILINIQFLLRKTMVSKTYCVILLTLIRDKVKRINIENNTPMIIPIKSINNLRFFLGRGRETEKRVKDNNHIIKCH